MGYLRSRALSLWQRICTVQLRNGYLRQRTAGKGFSYLHGQRRMPKRRSRKGGEKMIYNQYGQLFFYEDKFFSVMS